MPIVTARAIGDLSGWGEAALMFAAFSLTASGIYLVNDLCDLAADRQHAEKCRRPFASGALPLSLGLVAAPLLILADGALVAFAAHVLPVLALYAALSLGYSFYLKSQPVIDVFVLAGLYTIRLIGGGIVTGYIVSLWLQAFSSFLFLAVWRSSSAWPSCRRWRGAKSGAAPARARGGGGGGGRQRRGARDQQRMAGRGYLAGDAHALELMGVAASFVTSLVLALYVQGEIMPAGDHRPTLAWAIVPLILFWQCRIWFFTLRGEMHHDPIVYAARDWVSWVVTAASFAALLFGSQADDIRVLALSAPSTLRHPPGLSRGSGWPGQARP